MPIHFDHSLQPVFQTFNHAINPSRLSSLQRLVDHLFNRYSSLLVIRVDLNYHAGEHMVPLQAKRHLYRLLNRRRHNQHFKHLVGMAWKLEKGASWHFHTVWFFKGHKVCKDYYYAQALCEAWASATEGAGYGYNCHHRNRYKHFDVGMVWRDDLGARKRLMQTLAYLCKTDSESGLATRFFGRTTLKPFTNLRHTLRTGASS